MSSGARRREAGVVLLVDDSVDNRSMYAEYLAFEGFRVLEAEDGLEAVATARKKLPDVVVMDVVLPALDGIEATRMLRAGATTKKMIVLALSGQGAEGEARALAAGADRYIQKPCLPNELVAHLRELLHGRG